MKVVAVLAAITALAHGHAIYTSSPIPNIPTIATLHPVEDGFAPRPVVPTTFATSVRTKSAHISARSRPTHVATVSIQEYYQCGGSGFKGTGTCAKGLECKHWNRHYAQCVKPGATKPGPSKGLQPTSTALSHTSTAPAKAKTTATTSVKKQPTSTTTASADNRPMPTTTAPVDTKPTSTVPVLVKAESTSAAASVETQAKPTTVKVIVVTRTATATATATATRSGTASAASSPASTTVKVVVVTRTATAVATVTASAPANAQATQAATENKSTEKRYTLDSFVGFLEKKAGAESAAKMRRMIEALQ